MRVSGLIIMMLLTPFVYADTHTGDSSSGIVDDGASMDAETSTMSSTQAVERVASNFTDFLGDQSATVVEGLRNGEEFTLTSSYTDDTGAQQTETITIEPPTSKMGYGNVNITLKLAENQLAQAGITQPTAIQLETALLGGSITTPDGQVSDMQGVLTLRSDGMGWGQIAQQYDTRLGYIMGKGAGKAPTSSAAASPVTAGAKNNNGSGHSKVSTSAVTTGNGHAYGRGIVSASGASVGTVTAHGNGHAYGAGKAAHAGGNAAASSSVGRGIVSAGGAGVTHGNAGGNGKGLGRSK